MARNVLSHNTLDLLLLLLDKQKLQSYRWAAQTQTFQSNFKFRFLKLELIVRQSSNEGPQIIPLWDFVKLTSEAHADIFTSPGKSLRSNNTHSPIEAKILSVNYDET